MPNRNPAIRVTAMPADAHAYGDTFGVWLMKASKPLREKPLGLVT